jgi:hypothetical protein
VCPRLGALPPSCSRAVALGCVAIHLGRPSVLGGTALVATLFINVGRVVVRRRRAIVCPGGTPGGTLVAHVGLLDAAPALPGKPPRVRRVASGVRVTKLIQAAGYLPPPLGGGLERLPGILAGLLRLPSAIIATIHLTIIPLATVRRSAGTGGTHHDRGGGYWQVVRFDSDGAALDDRREMHAEEA